MNILITNDDGIDARGLFYLVEWAMKHGEVTVAAPKSEQSGYSQAINLVRPYEIVRTDSIHGAETYRVDSTPADCVRYAVLALGKKFDLVLSGINRGFNIGDDIVYSGTVGAVFEASYYGINAVAVSTDYASFDAAISSLEKIYGFFSDNRLFESCGTYNVNIPLNINGIRITRQGGACYKDEFVSVGKNLYIPQGTTEYGNVQDTSLDTGAVNRGFISVTPLSVSRTDFGVYGMLADRIKSSSF